MFRRIAIASLLIGVVLVALYRLPLAWFIGLSNAFLLAAGVEYVRLTAPESRVATSLLVPLLLALPWVFSFRPDSMIGFLVLAWLVVMIATLLTASRLTDVGRTGSAALFGLLYLGLPFALAGLYHPDVGGRTEVLLLMLTAVWVSDSAAFLIGRSLGSIHPTPALSPAKTLEGYLAALVAPSLLFAAAAPAVMPSTSVAAAAAVGLVVGAAATLGDLFESALKRGAGVKDSSSLLPGHGGVLDRIDSFLFAMPTFWLVAHLVDLQ